MATERKLRRDAAADLVSVTPVEGEPGYDITNRRLIVGDGARAEGVPHATFLDVQNQAFTFATAGGTANALTLDLSDGTLDYNPSAYSTGQRFIFKAASNNTGAATLNVNSLGAKSLKKNGGADDLEADDIVAGGIYAVDYDGTNFQVSGGVGGAAGGGSVMIVKDEKSAGTAGGTFTNTAWRTRTLNTVEANGISGASLSSNQVTLPAGDYRVEGFVVAAGVGEHKSKLRDVGGGTDLVIGSTGFSSTSAQPNNPSFVFGEFTLATSSALELQHQCASTLATNGFGRPAGFSVAETYAVLKFTKV